MRDGCLEMEELYIWVIDCKRCVVDRPNSAWCDIDYGEAVVEVFISMACIERWNTIFMIR